MCAGMRADMCVDMCVGMCTDLRSGSGDLLVHGHLVLVGGGGEALLLDLIGLADLRPLLLMLVLELHDSMLGELKVFFDARLECCCLF